MPRLGGRLVVVRRDLGVRIRPTTRVLLDRFGSQHHLDEAEVARVLLASGLFCSRSLAERIAIALFANGAMYAQAAATTIVAALRPQLAMLSATVARTAAPATDRSSRLTLGPGDPTLLRVRLHDVLHRRLRDLVEIYTGLRDDDDFPEAADETTQRLVAYLLSRPPSDVRRERSAVAEVVRWALTEAESDVGDLMTAYVRCRTAVWDRIDRAARAMRVDAAEALGAALEPRADGNVRQKEAVGAAPMAGRRGR